MLLSIKNLTLGYAGKAILPPVDLQIESGELWALIGLNGSGKTTLLKTLLGLLKPLSGSISWEEGKKVGYVPQRTTLDESIPGRVIDMVSLGVDHGWTIFNPLYTWGNLWGVKDAVEQAIEDTRIKSLVGKQFAELSEGQKQRVLMARALVSNPKLLVLDEPTSAMDVVTEHEIFELLQEMREKRGIAVLIVSHHLAEVARFASHAVVVDRDFPEVVKGPLEEVAHNPLVMQLFGCILQRQAEETDIKKSGEVTP